MPVRRLSSSGSCSEAGDEPLAAGAGDTGGWVTGAGGGTWPTPACWPLPGLQLQIGHMGKGLILRHQGATLTEGMAGDQ